MHSSIKRTTWVLMLILGCFVGNGDKTAYGLDDAGEARVRREALMVYSQMSVDSERVTPLTKGKIVILDVEIMGAEGAWCAITTRGTAPVQGYVRCEHLGRVVTRDTGREWVEKRIRATNRRRP